MAPRIAIRMILSTYNPYARKNEKHNLKARLVLTEEEASVGVSIFVILRVSFEMAGVAERSTDITIHMSKKTIYDACCHRPAVLFRVGGTNTF